MELPDPRSYEELRSAYERERANPDWLPVRLGFGSIDADIKGLSAGRVLVIAARTTVGKTSLIQTIEHNFAARTDAGRLSFTLEVTGEDWFERALMIEQGISLEEVEQSARDGELSSLSIGLERRMRNALVVEEMVGLNQLPGIFAKAQAKLNVPIRVVTIDYLGLLSSQGKDSYERASAAAVGIKHFAKSHKVGVIVASQLSRAGGEGEIPVTKDMLRDSGRIEESVDFIVGAWRPGKAPNLSDEVKAELRDVMTLNIVKNKRGPEGRWVGLRFDPDSRRLLEVADPFEALR